MKKTLLIITSLLFISSFVFPQTKVNKNNLVQYGDKWFKENDDTPYTGIVFDMSKETGNKILESKYVKGLPHGKHVEWYNDGIKKVEGIYKSGMMNGYWTFYYENGNEVGNQKIWDPKGNIKANYDVINNRRYGLTGQKNCVSSNEIL